MRSKGPLQAVRVLELTAPGTAPGAFATMLLSDLGADVVRVDRPDLVQAPGVAGPRLNCVERGRRSVAIDLKDPDGVALLLARIHSTDVLLEGFRPGVAERLGIGPDACLERNERLVYARMTGWGQEGPYATDAGHDLNYIAVGGVLGYLGRAGQPPPIPLNLVGDYGGGGMLAALGIACALFEAQRSGRGQVVDAAMIDGISLLMSPFFALAAMGAWPGPRGENLLDGGAHFYNVYETADSGFVTVAAIEPKFYARLLDALGVADDDLPAQMDRAGWRAMRERFAGIFRQRSRAEWCEAMAGLDACFAPVLDLDEASRDPHVVARGTVTEHDGVRQPAPAPRFSRTPGGIAGRPPYVGEHTEEVLVEWGLSTGEIGELRRRGVIAQTR